MAGKSPFCSVSRTTRGRIRGRGRSTGAGGEAEGRSGGEVLFCGVWTEKGGGRGGRGGGKGGKGDRGGMFGVLYPEFVTQWWEGGGVGKFFSFWIAALRRCFDNVRIFEEKNTILR